MIEIVERFSHIAESALGKIKVNCALNPILWMAAFCIPAGLWLTRFDNIALITAGLVLAFCPVVLFMVGFVYFMLKSPEKLRSEEYELRKIALELVEEKGGRIAVAEMSVEAISNVDYRSATKQQIERFEP